MFDSSPILTKGIRHFERRIREPCNLEPELGDRKAPRLTPPEVSFGKLLDIETTTDS